MALSPGAPPVLSDSLANENATSLRRFVLGLFFVFGGITSLNDVVIPKLKHLFSLGYAEAMLVQSAFFAAYFIVSIPAGMLVQRFGYLRSAVAGLLTMMLGCLLFVPASLAGTFALFLGALFVLAAGVTIVQVVANPLISVLGPPESASGRLTFAQAFNSLGTTVAPYLGAMLILGSLATVDEKTLSPEALAAFRTRETHVVVQAYVGIAAVLLVIAIVIWVMRNSYRDQHRAPKSAFEAFELLKRPRFAFGTLGIFLYVGAEVAIGSLLTSYLMSSHALSLPPREAGEHVAFYWGGAMVGRFIGSALLKVVPASRMLLVAACCAIGLIALSALSPSHLVAGWSLIAIGFFNSIMFPTIFSLACEGLGDRAPEGSGVICMAIVGGAIVPFITGYTADKTSLLIALAIPACCYAGIASFGWFARKPVA